MRANSLNLQVYPVIMEITGMKRIVISRVCSTDESESEEFLVDVTLSQVCSMDEEKSKWIVIDVISTEESESECAHKNINKK